MKYKYPKHTQSAAFTLIEIIGVLAIMTVMAGALVPNLVKRLANARIQSEAATVDALAEGLQDYVRNYQVIPGGKTWATDLAGILNYSEDQIQYAVPGDTTTERVYLVHPGFTPTSGSDPIYSQAFSGASTVANARILILASARPGLALPLSSGKPSNTSKNISNFEAIWNWSLDKSTLAPPAGWPKTWDNLGDQIVVSRVNLTPLFHRMSYVNTQFPTNAPYAQLGDDSVVTLNTVDSSEAWYLEGSRFRFFNHTSSSDVQLMLILNGSESFIYKDNVWEMP